MKSEQILIFQIESEYGHFRKFNTTSSPLTYSFPPRSAIMGILGAIMGIERETAPGFFSGPALADVFSKMEVDAAVQLIHPVKKVNIGFNLLDTEKTGSSFFNVKQRTQVEYELLKHPHFRIFLNFRDPALLKEAFSRLANKNFHFSPYLGLSQFTANIHSVCLRQVRKVEGKDFEEVLTAMKKLGADFHFDYSGEFKYSSETMPVALSKDRVALDYAEYILENQGRAIFAKSSDLYSVADYGNIQFL
jgi:CRISPR-associated protein Cas5h